MAVKKDLNMKFECTLLLYKFYWFLEHIFLTTGLQKYIEKKRLRTHSNLISIHEGTSENIIPIKELDISDKKLINKYISKNIPFIIKGGARSLEIFDKWDYKFLKDNFGHLEQPIFKNSNYSSIVRHAKVSEIIDRIENGDKDSNLLFGNLIYTNPPLKKSMNSFFFKNYFRYKFSILKVDHLFLSSKDTFTHSHTEFGENFFIQIKGKKRWRIFEPKYASIFRPLVQRKFYLQSHPEFGDLENSVNTLKFPHYDVIVEEGDLLYNPCLHWHYVQSLETSLSISSRWTNIFNGLRYPFPFFILATATNPSVWYQLTHKENTNPDSLY